MGSRMGEAGACRGGGGGGWYVGRRYRGRPGSWRSGLCSDPGWPLVASARFEGRRPQKSLKPLLHSSTSCAARAPPLMRACCGPVVLSELLRVAVLSCVEALKKIMVKLSVCRYLDHTHTAKLSRSRFLLRHAIFGEPLAHARLNHRRVKIILLLQGPWPEPLC